ncbi:hypothetical protein BDY21DRAFT_399863 [Lineolata rhizophorae]|uniref:Uncharacterized protein n=1 Tax=Lineolata rhizophorae TaxID=578093 RepID=A0A6A6NSF7_9PEZI|nr:hypothetical protein BDY21DRAFT_399863 [Lineolata rhizophorae]
MSDLREGARSTTAKNAGRGVSPRGEKDQEGGWIGRPDAGKAVRAKAAAAAQASRGQPDQQRGRRWLPCLGTLPTRGQAGTGADPLEPSPVDDERPPRAGGEAGRGLTRPVATDAGDGAALERRRDERARCVSERRSGQAAGARGAWTRRSSGGPECPPRAQISTAQAKIGRLRGLRRA